MRELLDSLLQNDLVYAKEQFNKRLIDLIAEKLNQAKIMVAVEMYDEEDIEVVSEANVQRMGRTKLIRVRIRGGKVQRRKKVSGVKGYTIRAGKMVRMSSQERRHRKMGARRAKFKRRAKLQQALRKRSRSLRRRRALGL
jgi:hypothetical protein